MTIILYNNNITVFRKTFFFHLKKQPEMNNKFDYIKIYNTLKIVNVKRKKVFFFFHIYIMHV